MLHSIIVFLSINCSIRRHLGGKLGENVRTTLGIEFVGEIAKYSLKELQDNFGMKNGLDNRL